MYEGVIGVVGEDKLAPVRGDQQPSADPAPKKFRYGLLYVMIALIAVIFLNQAFGPNRIPGTSAISLASCRPLR